MFSARIFLLASLVLCGVGAETQKAGIDAEAQKAGIDAEARKESVPKVTWDARGRMIVPMPQQCRFYRTILALDGGGLKGVITTQILKKFSDEMKTYLVTHRHLLQRLNRTYHFDNITTFHIDLADYFDAIAGISAGSWIATYLASKGGKIKYSARLFSERYIVSRYGYVRPGSLEGLEIFFLEFGTRIYPQSVPTIGLRQIVRFPTKLPAIYIPTLSSPTHPVNGLEWVLNQFLNDTKLSEAYTSLLVVAFDLNTRSALQFVRDKIVPTSLEYRRSQIAKALVMLAKFKEILSQLQEKTRGNCTESDNAKVREIVAKMASYKNLEDAFEGRGAFKEPPANKYKPRTGLGQIQNFVSRRSMKEPAEYLRPGMAFTRMDFYMKDVTRASSAFPMLHRSMALRPIKRRDEVHQIIDGAMVGNNPTMQAWIWLMRKNFIRVEEVATLSIGTGTVATPLNRLGGSGYLQWMMAMTFILLDDSSEFQQSTLDALFRSAALSNFTTEQSLRIQVKKRANEPGADILQFADNPTAMNELKQMGIETAQTYHWNMKHFISAFMFARCSKNVKLPPDSQLLRDAFESDYKERLESYNEVEAQICKMEPSEEEPA